MIRFLLDTGDGRTEEVALGNEVPADLTVLDWLRLHRRLTGTKEGCGSGDCGACTVVVASPAEDVGDAAGAVDGPPLAYESVNACIAFVGALHGRLLVTVESLARGGALHPVQQAMVDEHGSQCGFCTPGFVMSLYALYRAPDAPRVTFADERQDAGSFGQGSNDVYAMRTGTGTGTEGEGEGEGEGGSGGASTDPRPVDLGGPTPVVAYRSASNADAARATIGGEKGERPDGRNDDGVDPGSGSSTDASTDVREDAGNEARAGSSIDPDAGSSAETGVGPGEDAGSEDAGRTPPGGATPAAGLPMTMAAGWLDGFVVDDVAALSHRVDRTLGGNLCRCTGYRPIKRAAAVALAARAADRGEATDALERERAVAARLREIATVAPAHVGFHAPDSLDAFATLVEAHPDTPLLGGGTDLALEVTQKLRDLPRLIHVARVPELSRVEIDDGVLTLGAAVSLTRCMELLGERVPGAGELLLRFGSDPIRNRGTIGGNIASASPIGDLPPLLLALDATLLLQRGGSVRELPLDDFFTGYRETRLGRGEFVRAVRVPLPGERDVVAVYKVSKRMEDDISAVCGAFRLTLEGRRIVAARIAFGGMAATPARAHGAEAALVGAPFARRTIEAAGDALDDDFTPMSDARASAGYRARVARNLLLRLFLEAGGGAPVPVRLSLADTPGIAASRGIPDNAPGTSGDVHGER